MNHPMTGEMRIQRKKKKYKQHPEYIVEHPLAPML